MINPKETTIYTSPSDLPDDSDYLERIKKQLTSHETDPLKRYKLVSQIGEGGSGIIYKASEQSFERDLAIKVLKEKFRKNPLAIRRFLREAKTTAELEHPSIVSVHELGYSEDYGCFFTMQKITGESLQTILNILLQGDKRLRKKYNYIKLMEIFIKICQGIAYAHSKKIIHRDLKPENIIVGRFGQVLIIDWGLAKRMTKNPTKKTDKNEANLDDTSDVSKTVHGTINGTPTNMSPEQACGMQDGIGFKSDIYSLGTILYEMLCYHPPFEDKKLQTVLTKVVSGNFVPPSKKNKEMPISKELEAITIKAMETNPYERYDSVNELIDDVRSAIGNLPVIAYKAPLHHSIYRFLQRHRIITATAVSVFIGIIFSLLFVRIKTSTRVKANLETAENIMIQVNNTMLKAKALNRQIIVETDQELLNQYQRELKEAEVTMTSQITATLSLYSSAGQHSLLPNFALSKARPILKELINYALETQQPDMLDYSIRLAEDWSRKPLYPYIIDNRYIYESIVSYREGNGSLTVKITPEPLMVEIFKINETPRGDFETEEQPSIILKDGNRSVQIPKGEYVAHIETQHLDKIIYSFKIEHIEAEEINLHLPDKVPTQMIFIPGGPAWVGGPFSSHNKLINTNISSFFIKKYEVTFAEYYKFWRTLDTFNRNRYCPYIQLNENIKSYVPAWDKYGNYNSFCKPYLPVVGVTHEAADAFCKWLSIKENQKYRLPTNLEWEKAARGGDCRKFVWGNDHTLEKTFTRSNKEAKENYKFWAKPGSFPDDMSVYGVMDMSGNVREWTSTRFSTTDNFFLIKGGSAFTPDNFLYCEAESYTSFIPSDVGFRYIQEIEKPKVDNEN